jgi:aldehyde dehydrogenase (NAD+)
MAADSNLKNVTLELGGKSPAIVFEDADLDHAVRAYAYSSFSHSCFAGPTMFSRLLILCDRIHFAINHNSGQHCQANSRVLVHESIADQYLKELASLMSKVEIGDPFRKGTFQGWECH